MLRKNMFVCQPKNSCLGKLLVCVYHPDHIDKCIHIYLGIYVLFSCGCFSSYPASLTWLFTWRQWGWRGRKKPALCWKQQFSALESWIWILPLRGVPTQCQPCDGRCFSQLVVKTHLHCSLLPWTCRTASILTPRTCSRPALCCLALLSSSTSRSCSALRSSSADMEHQEGWKLPLVTGFSVRSDQSQITSEPGIWSLGYLI